MKKIFSALALLALLSGCTSICKSASCPEPEVPAAPKAVVTISQKSKYQILYPDLPANAPRIAIYTEAANMLKQALYEGVGISVPVRMESRALKGYKNIYLGDTKAARAAGIKVEDHPNFGFVIKEKNGSIFIAGQDKPRLNWVERRRMPWVYYILGTVNGCVKFAEKYLNTRFLYPGKNGIDYASKVGKFTIPAGLNEVCVPKLVFASHTPDMFYSYSNNAYSYGDFKSYGGHSYYDAVPVKKYAKTHPHYFAFRGGKRNPIGNHLCISNPEVQELIYQEMVKWAKQGAYAVQLAQTDGYSPCQCKNCKAYGNTADEGEKLWILHRKLAERFHKEFPGKFAHIICYGPTANPPKTFKKFPPNVIIELCYYTQENFNAWKEYEVKGGFTTYIYNWGWYNRVGFLPKRTPQFCADQVRLFIKNGVRGVYRCGFGENYGLEGPSYYAYGQMFNDIDQNETALVNDFIQRAFRESQVPMKLFYQTLFNRLSIYSSLQATQTMPQNPRVLVTAILSSDVIDVLEKNLARAEKLAKNPKVKARLELVRTEFDYAKSLATVLHFYNTYRLAPSQATFDLLAESIVKRNKLIDSFRDPKTNKTKVYSKNWPSMRIFHNPTIPVLKENGRLTAPIGAPLTWNIKLLKEQKILPGVGKKVMRIPRAVGKISTTDFNKGAWAKAKWYSMNGIQLGAVTEKTRFKAVYDAKHVYFAFESDVAPDKKFNALGKDGVCWGQDCMELILDPTGTRNIYYHLIVNPIENSYYDEAFGLITDELHPSYNKPDGSWNTKWSYTTKRVGGKWYLCFKIPFVSFNVPPASPGTIWYGNFGREAFFGGVRGKLELSLWSPNLETMSFHDRETFGDLIFE